MGVAKPNIKLNEKWDYADLLVQFGVAKDLTKARSDIAAAHAQREKLEKKAREWLEVGTFIIIQTSNCRLMLEKRS